MAVYRITRFAASDMDKVREFTENMRDVIEGIREGAVTEPRLRSITPAWRKLLARLMEQQWVQAETQQPPGLDPAPGPPLLDEQRLAVDSINSSLEAYHCHLLDGITGSGKT